MQRLVAISRVLDWPSRILGPTLPWLVAAVVLLKFSTVGLRYVFHTTNSMLQDSVTYGHATLFMLMAGYAWLKDDHVRVDMFYAKASARTKAWVELGCVVLGVWPLLAILTWSGWPYVSAAWKIKEGAMFFGGLPFTYLLKGVIAAFVVLLAIQSLAILLRAIAVISGSNVRVLDPSVHETAAEGASHGNPAA